MFNLAVVKHQDQQIEAYAPTGHVCHVQHASTSEEQHELTLLLVVKTSWLKHSGGPLLNFRFPLSQPILAMLLNVLSFSRILHVPCNVP